MILKRYGMLVLGLLMGGSAVPAQQNETLTLTACIELGLKNSKALHASQMATQAAEAQVQEAQAARLPLLTWGGEYRRLSEVTPFEISLPSSTGGTELFTVFSTIPNTYSTRLSVQQPIFTGFQIESGIEATQQEAQAAQEDHAGDRIMLTYRIKQAYWALFRANAVKKVVDENVGQVQVHLQDVQNRYDQGMMTDNEVLKVQVQLSHVKLLQIQADHAVERAMLNLDNLIGVPLDTRISLATTEGDSSRSVGDLGAYLARAEANRSELKAVGFRVKAAEAGVKRAESGRLPRVFLTGGYTYARPNPRIVPQKDTFNDTWDVGIAVSFNVWDGGRTAHQTDAARAQFLRLQDVQGEVADAVRLEVRQRYLNLVEAKARITVAAQGVQQAEESYRATRTKFEVGMAPNSDLLDVEVALLKAKTDYTQTLVDFEIARAGLEKAIGEY